MVPHQMWNVSEHIRYKQRNDPTNILYKAINMGNKHWSIIIIQSTNPIQLLPTDPKMSLQPMDQV